MSSPQTTAAAEPPIHSGEASTLGASISGAYGVKLVRGPRVAPRPHPRASRDLANAVDLAVKARQEGRLVAVDLFCGAGGLSLGLQEAGFEVVLGVDSDPLAVETHSSTGPGLAACLDLSTEEATEWLDMALERLGADLIAAGPPCQPFSRAGMAKISHLVDIGARSALDERRTMWKVVVDNAIKVKPSAVLIENVPDMALAGEMIDMRSMVDRLEEAGYHVHTRLLNAWEHGVPQHRQRFFLVALLQRNRFEWPRRTGIITVADAIDDLPPVAPGYRPEGGADGFIPYDTDPTSAFQKRARRGSRGTDKGKVFDHITRPARSDDLEAFSLLAPGGTYRDLPERLRRYRVDIFDDKYKRLDGAGLSRTITAHIAKDGYWYIHPTQDRTLTIREAARLQTFPDHIRFAGPPSKAFKQIGNAVPPALGKAIGLRLAAALKTSVRDTGSSTRDLQHKLATWFKSRTTLVPWLRSGSTWKAAAGEVLAGRSNPENANAVWELIRHHESPGDTLRTAAEWDVLAVGLSSAQKRSRLLSAATHLAAHPNDLDSWELLRRVPGIGEAVANTACLVGGSGMPIPATAGITRAAARFSGGRGDAKNARSRGRMEVARLAGIGPEAASATLALAEIGRTLCTKIAPACSGCPLRDECASAR